MTKLKIDKSLWGENDTLPKNKYSNKKTVFDDILFHSKAEARYYAYLKGLKDAGIVKSITLQPRFLLQEAFKKNGITHAKIEYIADFLVDYGDHTEIIDVKGAKTDVFKLKRKLFERRYENKTIKLLKLDKKRGFIDLDEEERAEKEAKKKLRKMRKSNG